MKKHNNKNIIGKEDYFDGMTRIVLDDLTVCIVDGTVNASIPNFWDVVEAINTGGLIESNNLKLKA